MRDLKHDLKVSELTVHDSGLSTNELLGIVENISPTLFHYVEVQFNAYDKDGFQVDSVIASVNNLEPSGKWKFQTPMSNHGTNVRLVRIIADDGEKEASTVFLS